jgi:hypothetical protein
MVLLPEELSTLNVNIFFTMMQFIEILCMNILHDFNLNHSHELFHIHLFPP